MHLIAMNKVININVNMENSLNFISFNNNE